MTMSKRQMSRAEVCQRLLDYKVHHQQQKQAVVADSKQVEATGQFKPVKQRRKFVPAANHKWGNFRLAGSKPPKPVK